MNDLLYGPSDTPPVDNPAAAVPADQSAADAQAARSGVQGSALGDWRAGLAPEMRSLAEAKGWKSQDDALKSYANLEKAMGAGAGAVILPKDEEDAEAFDKIYAALGRPENPDGYGLTEVVGDAEVNTDFLKGMGAAMHEAGVSKRQAAKLAEAWMAQESAAMEAMGRELAAQEREIMGGLSPADLELIRRGYKSTGLPAEMTGRVAMVLGPRVAVDIFRRLGASAAEDSAPGGRGGESSAGSPEAARRRISQLNADQNFRRRYDEGEPEAVEEMSRLFKIVAQGQG